MARWQRIFKLSKRQILQAPETLCLNGLASIVNQIPLPHGKKILKRLRHPPLKDCFPTEFSDEAKIFKKIRKRDILLHHPYDSFDAFLLFIRRACKDPKVKKIELTVYRTDKLSPVINELKKAAATKKVFVLIELRARFDELNNLRLAEELRKAGAQVGFGVQGLKMHAKLALITRREASSIRRYAHLSTGNYHAGTARQYTDLAILIAHPGIGRDVRYFFDQVRTGKIPNQFKTLVSAPGKLHRRIRQHIDQEINAAKRGEKAGIFAKVNALVDHEVIKKLYEASSHGVRIDLVVRGACSLVPGVRGLSENIRVISIVDRFLEHSRIYYFKHSKKMYFSSADWMPRNFFSRLEIAFPVLDDKIFEFVSKTVIPAYLRDNIKAKELAPQGTWKSIPRKGEPLRAQFYFAKLAEKKSRGKNP